nr:hypothetical protein [Ningiella sp. W23]
MRHLILCFALVLLCSCKTTQPEIIAPTVSAPVEQKAAQSNTPTSTNTNKVINKKQYPKPLKRLNPMTYGHILLITYIYQLSKIRR